MSVCRRHARAVFRLDTRGTDRCVLCAQERVGERRRHIKRILVEEAGGCCAACGYDRLPAALHFHHINAAEKSGEVLVLEAPRGGFEPPRTD